MSTKQELIEKVARCVCGESHNPKDHEALAEVIVETVIQSEVKLWEAVAREICKYNKLESDSEFTMVQSNAVGWRPLSILHGFSDAAKDAINLIRSGEI